MEKIPHWCWSATSCNGMPERAVNFKRARRAREGLTPLKLLCL